MIIDVSVPTPFGFYNNRGKGVGCERGRCVCDWAGEGDSHTNVVPGPRCLNGECARSRTEL